MKRPMLLRLSHSHHRGHNTQLTCLSYVGKKCKKCFPKNGKTNTKLNQSTKTKINAKLLHISAAPIEERLYHRQIGLKALGTAFYSSRDGLHVAKGLWAGISTINQLLVWAGPSPPSREQSSPSRSPALKAHCSALPFTHHPPPPALPNHERERERVIDSESERERERESESDCICRLSMCIP